MDIPLQERDGETYVTTNQAAALMRVAKCTITRWRYRGYLRPIDGSPPRKPLYALSDVREAEWKARQAAIEASGSDAQVRRTREVP